MLVLKKLKSLEIGNFILVFAIVAIVGLMLGGLCYYFFHAVGLWTLGGKEDYDVIEIHAVSLSLLTAGLIAVAYLELSNANENLRSEFLLKIDKRFTSREILDAETLIHELCHDKGVKNIEDEARIKEVSDEIVNLSKQRERARDFNCLLNFLDFLETIAYMSNQQLMSVKDVQELLGGTLFYYHKIFGSLIEHQKEYLKQPHYYRELKIFTERAKLV